MGHTQRRLLGWVSFAMIMLGAVAVISGSQQPLFSIVMRVGIVLFGIWLAWPQFALGKWRSSLTVALGIVAVILVLAAKPKLLPIVAAVLVGLAIVQIVLRNVVRALGAGPDKNKRAK